MSIVMRWSNYHQEILKIHEAANSLDAAQQREAKLGSLRHAEE